MRVIVCILLSLVCASYGAKILCTFPATSHSHFTIGLTLVKALAEKGHEVTFLSPFPVKEQVKNLKPIVLSGIYEHAEEMQKDFNIFELFEIPTPFILFLMGDFGLTFTDLTFSNNATQELLNGNETFDVVITEHFLTEGLQALAHHFKAHSVIISTFGPSVWSNFLMANPSVPSYMPHPFTGYTQYMNFWQRIRNFYVCMLQYLYNTLYYLPRHNDLLRKYLPNAPDIYDVMKSARLHLLNSDSSFSGPFPLTQNMVEIGGFHVQPPKKLPVDLQEFLDNAKEGVIYFSMGGNLKSKDFPEATRKQFLQVFAKLKHKILWKFEDDLPERSANVEIRKWFPQSDVLAHPNIVLFITHGGLLGTTESLYHGVPVLGIPVFGDQGLNMRKAIEQGYGKSIPYVQLTAEKLSVALEEMLTNSTYTQNAKRISALMKDKQVSQTEKAVYSVEYVIRHNGASHLQSAAHDLNWFQYYSLDVILFFIVINVLCLKVFCLIIKKFCCKRKTEKKQKTS